MNTTYFLNTVMGNLFHTKETPSIPEAYYIGLSASEPTIGGVCNGEPSVNGTGYRRVKLENLSVPQSGVITNTDPISFNESISDWGVMTHYIVYDAETGGNLLFYDSLSAKRTVEANTVFIIKSNELTIALKNAT